MSSRVRFMILIFFSVIIVNVSRACLFKKIIETKKPPQSKKSVPKTLPRMETQDCECGKDPAYLEDSDLSVASNYPEKPWNLYVHVFDSKKDHLRTCTGTLINSRMVLTSHTCLKTRSGRTAPFEMWDLAGVTFEGVLARKEDLKIDQDGDPSANGFPIEDVIYNKRWENKDIKGLQPDDDVVILVLDGIWPLSFVPPICLPRRVKTFDPIGYKGYYYGLSGKRTLDSYKDLIFVGDVVILPGKECDNDNGLQNFSTNVTLCIQHRRLPPTTTGGPLVLETDGKLNKRGYTPGKQVFLMGLVSIPKWYKNRGSTKVTTYFSNVIPLIPYLESYADQYGAEWCQNPPSYQPDLASRINPGNTGLKRRFAWEGRTPIKRDESLDCVCGLENEETNVGRVTGGEVANAYEFPWQVLINSWFNNYLGEGDSRNTSTCGGSIINDRMILTAAHCLIRESRLMVHDTSESLADTVHIYAIKHKFKDDPNEEMLKVKKVYFLKDYVESIVQEEPPDGDIALIELEVPLVFSPVTKHVDTKSKDIRPICLPRDNHPIIVVGRNATITGWGEIESQPNSENWKPAEKLRKLQLPILPLQECIKRSKMHLRDSVICAGYFTSFQGSSKGDGGGPLAISMKNGYWTQVGIVSYEKTIFEDYSESEYSHNVALYTNVQKFIRFVDYFSNKVEAKWCKSYV